MLDKKQFSQVHNVTSYNQSGGITAHTINVNPQRAISSKAQVIKEKRGDEFVLQIVLSQTPGAWDQGTMFKLQVKTSGPYKIAKIVKGMPMALQEVIISENKENGLFSFSTRTAPLKDESIVLEIISTAEVNLEQLGIEPLAKNE